MIIGSEEALFFASDAEWETAQAALLEAGFGDGLPLVVPTRARLAAMLQGVAEPEASLGMMAPMFGELTIEAIAYCCILAGCVPAELPVVAAAAVACTDDSFNLLGIQTTTGSPTTALMVGGPVAERLGMNAGTNCLGPGNRANACIGRALRLVTLLIGGAKPLVGDMATMGQPGKYTFAFAEGAHALLRPFAERQGLPAGADAVTVFGVSGHMEVLPEGGADTPEAVLRPVVAAMQGSRVAGDAAKHRAAEEQLLLLTSEMADIMVKAGWDEARMQRFIFDAAGADWPIAQSPAHIRIMVTGGAGVKMTCLVPWGGGTVCVTRPVVGL